METTATKNVTPSMILLLTAMNLPYMLGCLLFIVEGFSSGVTGQTLLLAIVLVTLGGTYYYALNDYRFAVWINIFALLSATTYLLRDGWLNIISLLAVYFH